MVFEAFEKVYNFEFGQIQWQVHFQSGIPTWCLWEISERSVNSIWHFLVRWYLVPSGQLVLCEVVAGIQDSVRHPAHI